MAATARESMEVDVLFVGAGPATLASALHLMNQVKAHNERVERTGGDPIEPPTVLVIEKGAAVGDHILSGAVMNPRGIEELVPDFAQQGFPTEYVCDDASFWLYTRKHALRSPMTPPNFQKKGYHVVSLSNVAKWLAERCEAAGVEIYPGFAGDTLLIDGHKVVGVRIGDMGIDKHGKHKPNYQPGMDIFAKVTVLGEGVRGSLSKQLIERFELEGAFPQVYETGIKEIWRVRPENHQPGRVVHGALLPDMLRQFNGMWLYDMKDQLVSFGFVTMLDSQSPLNDPHLAAQEFKTIPWMRKLLDGAELVRYGAKTIPMGGLYAQPKLYCDGAMLIGDAGGFCNAFKLSGIHLAIKSGMMAADTLVDGLKAKDFTAVTLGAYAERYRAELGLHRAPPSAQLPRLDRGEPPVRARPQHPSDARDRWPRDQGSPPVLGRPPPHEETLRASRASARAQAVRIRREAHLHQGAPRPVQRRPARGRPALPSCRRRYRPVPGRVLGRVWQSLREVLPGRRLRDGAGRRPSGEEEAVHPSTRTACTARPAISPIPTRSSRGPRPKGAKDQITHRCNRERGSGPDPGGGESFF